MTTSQVNRCKTMFTAKYQPHSTAGSNRAAAQFSWQHGHAGKAHRETLTEPHDATDANTHCALSRMVAEQVQTHSDLADGIRLKKFGTRVRFRFASTSRVQTSQTVRTSALIISTWAQVTRESGSGTRVMGRSTPRR